MPFDVVVGRGESEKKKFGKRGTIFIAKNYVKMGQTTSLSNPIYLDVTKAHVIFIVGKRGSGKSYSASVIAESMVDLEEDIAKNLAIIMIDTMGVFWTMKYPNEKDLDLLESWKLEPKGLKKIEVYTPIGMFQETLDKGIPVDKPFSIQATELTGEDWRLAFELPSSHPVGIFIDKMLGDFAEKRIDEYNLDDMIHAAEIDNTFDTNTKNETINRLKVAKTWGLFSEESTKISDLIQGGKVTILDTSAYITSNAGWAVRALVVGLVTRKIFIQRMISRQLEEIESIKVGYSYFKQEAEEREDKKPLVWFIIDECITGDTKIHTNKGHTPIKEIEKRLKKKENPKVMSYCLHKKEYSYKKITKFYKKGEKETIKLTTETGKKLTCTKEHPILTSCGFISAENAIQIGSPTIYHHDKRKELIKARLFGHIIGDGYLSKNKKSVGFSGKGNKKDLILIKKDLKELGFKSGNIYTRETNSKITTSKGKTHKVKGISQELRSSTYCHNFFSKLGAPIGTKIESKFKIPNWLKRSSKKEKSEFLAALVASDGIAPKQQKKSHKAISSIRYTFNYLKEREKEGQKLAKDIQKLFKDIGIKTSLSKREGNIRKNGKITEKYVITIHNEIKNTINFLEKIGYRYCEIKEKKAKRWLAYLKAKEHEGKKLNQLKKKAIKLHKEKGWGKIKVAKHLNVEIYQARDWLYKNYKTRARNNFPNFRNWIKEREIDNIIFENIENTKSNGTKEVFDITVEDNHNFLANDLIIHNCHNFLPATGKTAATDSLVTLLREGRQPGISLILITQQPGKVHTDVMTQSDIVLAHRLTAQRDVKALNSMMQSYLGETLTGYLNMLPSEPGAAIILDDNSERLYPIRIRPKFSWHGGEAPSAIKYKRELPFKI